MSGSNYIQFIRQNQTDDTHPSPFFQKFSAIAKHAVLKTNSKGQALTIGNRVSVKYRRIYQLHLGLKFELEIKKIPLNILVLYF